MAGEPRVEIGNVVNDARANLKKGRAVIPNHPQLIEGGLAEAEVIGRFLSAEFLARREVGHLRCPVTIPEKQRRLSVVLGNI
jgi:hypothetical protein